MIDQHVPARAGRRADGVGRQREHLLGDAGVEVVGVDLRRTDAAQQVLQNVVVAGDIPSVSIDVDAAPLHIDLSDFGEKTAPKNDLMATVGAFIIAAAILVFVWNVIVSLRNGQEAGGDPWDAFTLEWDTTSPPQPYNFATVPIVRSRRPFYDKKNPEIADWKTATH